MVTRKQILVVEDNDINRSMLCEILSDKYQVLEAENGKEALEILKQNKESITLILLDIQMPVMDGYAFLDIVKKDEELSLIPVIVMTQGDKEDDEVEALARGATDFVPKPYRPNVILHRIAGIIKLRETAAIVNQFKYDRLTGMYTKEFFYRKVRESLDENPEKDYLIICSNYENFKLYNDIFGRKAGNQVLVEGAQKFQRRVGENAVCCRYSADRFLCFMEKPDEKTIREKFVPKVENERTNLVNNAPVKFGIYEIRDPSLSVEQMCDRAFLAADSIKGVYNRNVALYDDTLRERLLWEKEIADDMVMALKEGKFSVCFQPKYSLQDNKIAGAEALIRWNHPKWGVIFPGDFIPLFERNGFISYLDMFVWETVCAKLNEWKEKGYPLLPISVNISRADIYRYRLTDTFCALIQKYEIEPEFLHLEITESAYTEHQERLISTVEALRGLDFIIEMDDFGRGYSSLNMLSQMSLDILKLDMEFVQNEIAKPAERSILNDIISMAHRMHLIVVAEGIETWEQAKFLEKMGCDYGQGYYFSTPMSAAEFEEFLKNQSVHNMTMLKHKKSRKDVC